MSQIEPIREYQKAAFKQLCSRTSKIPTNVMFIGIEEGAYRAAYQHLLKKGELYLKLGSTLAEAIPQVQTYREVYEAVLDLDYSMKKVTYNERKYALKGIKAAMGWLEDLATVRFNRDETA